MESIFFVGLRKSTGQSQNRCVLVGKCLVNSKRAEQGKQSLLGSQFVYIGVFSDDFAAVDFREELCYHSRPEKANSRDVKQLVMKLLCIFPWKSFDGFSNNFKF